MIEIDQTNDHNQKVVALIPAYNEVLSIADVAKRVLAQNVKLIVVDDGSTDGTVEALKYLDVQVICHETNSGKAASLMTGFKAALSDPDIAGVVTLDGDGQHQPEDISKMIEAYQQHPGQIIIGSRLHDREQFPPERLRANEIANFWISWAAGYAIEDSQSGFRFYPTELLRNTSISHDRDRSFVFESEILIRAARSGIKSHAVPIPAIYDSENHRPSHFRPVADIVLIVRMVAWQLISRAMYPQGLYQLLREKCKKT
ncbi:MAG: glycosyltransferase family 2 protein [Magnetovibrio sp.]|nr:glycosyltransferase family 2 protein [Magnetovibrio sp.]